MAVVGLQGTLSWRKPINFVKLTGRSTDTVGMHGSLQNFPWLLWQFVRGNVPNLYLKHAPKQNPPTQPLPTSLGEAEFIGESWVTPTTAAFLYSHYRVQWLLWDAVVEEKAASKFEERLRKVAAASVFQLCCLYVPGSPCKRVVGNYSEGQGGDFNVAVYSLSR